MELTAVLMELVQVKDLVIIIRPQQVKKKNVIAVGIKFHSMNARLSDVKTVELIL